MWHSLKQRFIALMLLMAYTITCTSVMPAAMALAAWIDGSHQSFVRMGESGAQIVLHHRLHEYTPKVSDHRGRLAQMLVRLSCQDQNGDHQLITEQLAASSSSERHEPSKVRSGDDLFNAQATQEWQHLLHISQPRLTRDDVFVPRVSISHQPPSLLTTIQLLI